MISIASRDAFGGFTFTAFSAKNISVVVAVMISRVFNVFLPIKAAHLLHRVFSSSDLMHITSFWWLILFFIDLFFICSLRSVICKKYTNHGKDSKYTNELDISITGGSVGSAVGRSGGSVVAPVVSLLTLLVFPLPFFASFKILPFNLFI